MELETPNDSTLNPSLERRSNTNNIFETLFYKLREFKNKTNHFYFKVGILISILLGLFFLYMFFIFPKMATKSSLSNKPGVSNTPISTLIETFTPTSTLTITSTPTQTQPPISTSSDTQKENPTDSPIEEQNRPTSPPPRQEQTRSPRINIPYFSGSINTNQTSIFWYGRINQSSTDNQENYTDVKMGYNDSEIYLNYAVFDKRISESGDIATLYLSPDGNVGNTPKNNSYEFNVTFNFCSECKNIVTTFKGDGYKWIQNVIKFSSATRYRGSVNPYFQGWVADMHIPFKSLGLSSKPTAGSKWGMALITHDKDNNTNVSNGVWPNNMNVNNPSTWGVLSFGMPTYTPGATKNDQTVKIQRDHRLNAIIDVQDADVGGFRDCGRSFGDADDSRWTGWGNTNYYYDPGTKNIHNIISVQNNADISNWVCFDKIYIKFPLNRIPKGKIIKSAKLVFTQTAPDRSDKYPRIQVALTNSNWDAKTITWNNAPLINEIITSKTVGNLVGGKRTLVSWDVAYGLNKVYSNGENTASFVLYTPEESNDSWKYFDTSYVDDFYPNDCSKNPKGENCLVKRPYLEIIYGDRG